MKYATCKFDEKLALVCDDNGSLEWHEGDLIEAQHKAESKDNFCALFYPGDVPDLGYPIERNVSREKFEEKPGVYGVCYYHSAHSGYVFE